MFFPILFPSYGIHHHMGNARVCPLISHSTEKCNKTHHMWRNWEIGTHSSSYSICAFFPLDSHPVVYFIVWEMDGFCHCFPISWKRQQNASSQESMGSWFPCSFYSMGVFCIRFHSCGMLHYMGNTCAFSASSNIMEQAAKSLE